MSSVKKTFIYNTKIVEFSLLKHYSRGIDAALAKFFGKHKSFLKNGQKSKTGKVKAALDRLAKLTPEESSIIAQQKFEEWAVQKYSKFQLNIKT